MNTRLQVEHTVTEMITGLDLVREQILIASGAETEYGHVQVTGHAIQARICAEKSDGTYQPSTGTIETYIEPTGVRIDTGIAQGSIVSGKYDNMLAKLIVHRPTRAEAMQLLANKLGQYVINGIHTNIPLIIKLLHDTKFINMQHYTRYLQTEFEPPRYDAETAAALAAILLYETERNEGLKRYGSLAGYSNTAQAAK